MVRLLLAVLAVFVLWEVTDVVIHGVILGQAYEDRSLGSSPTVGGGDAKVFRAPADMKMPLLLLVVLTHAAVFVKIYAWLISPKNILTGVVFGLLWGVGHGVGMGYGTYATMPIPASMASTWCLAAIVQGVLGGIVTALIVRRRDEPPP